MKVETNNGKQGGILKGNLHTNGGIKAIVTDDNNRPVELETDEAIVNRKTMLMNEKFEFEGEQKTPKQIISELNVAGGGVEIFKDGGAIESSLYLQTKKYFPKKLYFNRAEMLFEGKIPKVLIVADAKFSTKFKSFLQQKEVVNLFFSQKQIDTQKESSENIYLLFGTKVHANHSNQKVFTYAKDTEQAIEMINAFAETTARINAKTLFNAMIQEVLADYPDVAEILVKDAVVEKALQWYEKGGTTTCESCNKRPENYVQLLNDNFDVLSKTRKLNTFKNRDIAQGDYLMLLADMQVLQVSEINKNNLVLIDIETDELVRTDVQNLFDKRPVLCKNSDPVKYEKGGVVHFSQFELLEREISKNNVAFLSETPEETDIFYNNKFWIVDYNDEFCYKVKLSSRKDTAFEISQLTFGRESKLSALVRKDLLRGVAPTLKINSEIDILVLKLHQLYFKKKK